MKKPEEAVPNSSLRNARERMGWTQEELAEKIGTTSVTISRWESGITMPSRYYHKKLSTLYGKSIEELGLLQSKNGRGPINSQAANAGNPNVGAASPARVRSIFLFNEPLTNVKELYGRGRERDILINRTFNGASTSIIGPRRIGKSWLTNYLRLVAPSEFGSRFRIGYLDATMPSCKTIGGFTAEALEELGMPNAQLKDGLICLERGLKALKSKNYVSVLCIDEFEGLGNKQEFPLDFFRALRAMTQKHGLVLVTVSRLPLRTVVGKDVETSGFFNIFEQLTLTPFNAKEAEGFITSKQQQGGLTQQECDLLWKYGEERTQEWPPLRLQLAGKLLREERNQRKDSPSSWQAFERRLEEIYREAVY